MQPLDLKLMHIYQRRKLDPRAETGILVGYASGGKGYRILIPKTCPVKVCNVVHVDESNVLQTSNLAESTVQSATQQPMDVSFNNVFAWQSAQTTCEWAGPSPRESSSSEGEPGKAMPRVRETTTVRQSARSNKGVPPPMYGICASVQPVKELNNSETFAPVVSYTSFSTLLSIAASRGMHIEHLDIKTAFLNGDLTEKIYMKQPEGFSTEGQEGLVCKLNKSVYGLKQAAKAWNEKLTKLLQKQSFQQGIAEPCLFSRLTNGKYVDDLIICCQNQGDVQEIADELNREVEVKQFGTIKYYLGIQIERTEDGSFLLSQKQKIMDFIESVGMKDSNPVSTPLDKDYPKLTDGKPLKDNHEYRSAIGKLLYLSTICRPDITSAVGILCRKTSSPDEHDWKAIKRLARYLKGTLDYKLKISACDEPRLTGYMDANWDKNSPDGKSTSGYLFYYGNSLIGWTSQKQSIVAVSTGEVECVSAQSASYELYWIIHLLKDFGIDEPKPIILFEDNQACIAICKGEGTKSKNKTIALKCYYVTELQDQGLIELQYCPTDQMIADILTKPLDKQCFETLRECLNLHDFRVVT